MIELLPVVCYYAFKVPLSDLYLSQLSLARLHLLSYPNAPVDSCQHKQPSITKLNLNIAINHNKRKRSLLLARRSHRKIGLNEPASPDSVLRSTPINRNGAFQHVSFDYCAALSAEPIHPLFAWATS